MRSVWPNLDWLETWKVFSNGADTVGCVPLNTNWYIGSSNGNARFFDGEIRDVSIWNTSLTASQSAAVYAETAPSADYATSVTAYTCDALNRLTSLTDPVGNTTSYTYDYRGLVLTETNEKNATRYYSYDSLGRLVQKTDRNDRVTTYAYDSVGRLTAEHWANTADYFMYTYDLVGNLLYATDGDHSYSYTYDALYRPIYTSFNFDSQSAVFSYTYDLAGRQTSSSLTLNGRADRVNEVTYDYLGNATTIKQTGNITDEIFAEFDYNANGLLTAINRYEEDENDVLTAVANSLYEYNANNAVTSITHKNPDETQIVKHSYTYDETNNIVEYLNSIDGATSYDYDFLGQLVSADYASQTDESYVYDSNGNRIVANGDAYTTGTNNELTSDGNYTYTYDAEGNRISKSNSTDRELYEWDYRNRLTKVTQQTFKAESQTWETVQIVEYAYDYNNIWIRKTLDFNGDGTADSKTLFIPESYQTTVQLDDTDLTDSTGPVVTHHYLWTPNQQDKLLADTTSTEVLWSLTDHLGTIRDVLGATSTHLIYDAFGNLSSGTNPLLFGYTGKAFDTATNLQNNINRWYDVKIGRWLSTDPIGFSGGYDNLFKYVANNPVSATDPSGLVLNSIINYIDTYSRVTSKVTEVFDKIKGALGGKEIQVSPNFNIQIESRTEICEFGCRHEIKEVSITANSLKGDITVNRHGAVSLGFGPNSLKVNANVYIIASVDFNLKAKAIFEHKCLGHLGLAGIYFYKGGGIESQRFDIGIKTGFNLNGNLEIKGKSIVNANAQAYLTGKIVGNFEFIHKPTIANFNHSGFLRLSAQGVVHGGVTIKMNGQTLYELSVGSQTPVLVFETQLF